MAKSFNINAQLTLSAPTNIAAVRTSIQKGLGSIPIPIKFSISKTINTNIQALNQSIPGFSNNLNTLAKSSNNAAAAVSNLNASFRSLKSVAAATTAVQKSASSAAKAVDDFGQQTGIALRRFSAFAIAAGGLVSAIQLVRDGFKQALDFQNQLVRLSQITGTSIDNVQKIGDTIGNLSTSLGVSSKSLSEVADTIAQAGFSAKETTQILTALAKTDLAPTFEDIASTTEGSVAILRQFG